MRPLFSRRAAISLIPLILSGCRITTEADCDFEQRHVLARGTAAEGMDVGDAHVSVGAMRGSRDDRSVGWSVHARSLSGHVTSITLVNLSQRVPVLLEMSVTPVGLPFAFMGWFIQESGATNPALEGIFEIVAANQAGIEITTDLPDQPLIVIPLTVETMMDWSPADCYR